MIKGNGKTHMFEGSDSAWYLGEDYIKGQSAEEVKKANDGMVDKQVSLYNKQVQDGLMKAKETQEMLSGCSIRPFGSYMLVKPCDNNIFKVMSETKSGIILNPFKGTFVNPDSGEKDRMAPVTEIAQVIDPGECDKIKQGDYVFYRSMASTELPFMEMGYEVVAHQNVIAVVSKKQ